MARTIGTPWVKGSLLFCNYFVFWKIFKQSKFLKSKYLHTSKFEGVDDSLYSIVKYLFHPQVDSACQELKCDQ